MLLQTLRCISSRALPSIEFSVDNPSSTDTMPSAHQQEQDSPPNPHPSQQSALPSGDRPITYPSDITNDISVLDRTLATKSRLAKDDSYELEIWKEAVRNKVTELCEDIECLEDMSSQEGR